MADDTAASGPENTADEALSKLRRDRVNEADTAFIPALLLAKIDALEKQLNDLKPRKKDFFERLSQLSALITGGAIAGVGTVATIYYNANQNEVRQLEAMDKFRTYLSAAKSPDDRKFGYFALTKLGQEKLAIDLITAKRDQAGEEVLADIASTSKDEDARAAARKGLTVLRSDQPGCEVLYTVPESGLVQFLNGWETKNIQEVPVPQLAKIPNGPISGKIQFNIRGAEALKDGWAEIEQRGLLDRVLSWDGGYVARTRVGANKRLSSHACGLAFDINASTNPTGRRVSAADAPGSLQELVPIFEKHGFRWGGNFKGYPDPMHFEYVVTHDSAPTTSAEKP